LHKFVLHRQKPKLLYAVLLRLRHACTRRRTQVSHTVGNCMLPQEGKYQRPECALKKNYTPRFSHRRDRQI
jgi:hypothetical protein